MTDKLAHNEHHLGYTECVEANITEVLSRYFETVLCEWMHIFRNNWLTIWRTPYVLWSFTEFNKASDNSKAQTNVMWNVSHIFWRQIMSSLSSSGCGGRISTRRQLSSRQGQSLPYTVAKITTLSPIILIWVNCKNSCSLEFQRKPAFQHSTKLLKFQNTALSRDQIQSYRGIKLI